MSTEPLVKRDIIVNGNKIVFPRRSISFEEVAELAGHTGGNPSVTWRVKDKATLGDGIMEQGDTILLEYGITIFNAVYTGNA